MAASGLSSSKIVLIMGSRNREKCREIAELIAPPWEPSLAISRLEVRSVDDFVAAPEVVEDADSFAGNARKKASELARPLGHWVIADDSGLAVAALDGAPGVFSARYAGEPTDNEANNRKLLDELANVPDDRRGAAFHCALALADPAGTIRLEAAGACRGRITSEPRGQQGFGYDPLFLIAEYHRTFGELSPLVKHQLSHRARAFAILRRDLNRMIVAGDFDEIG